MKPTTCLFLSLLFAISTQAAENFPPEAKQLFDAHLANIVLFKDESAFTQKVVGSKKIPYELRGFEIVGPREIAPSRPERAKGIERKLLLSIKVSEWRTYDPEAGWSEWKPGRPNSLGGISLHLHGGTWEIATTPLGSYTAGE